MVFAKQQTVLPVEVGRRRLEFFAELFLLKELVLQPNRHRHPERAKPMRGKGQISLQQPLEFEKRLVVKGDMVDVG